jgi:hypothetical protein
VAINGHKRKILDFNTLVRMLRAAPRADLVVLEMPGGITDQSCSASFAFGRGCGLIEAVLRLVFEGVSLHLVAPTIWKRALKIPGKKKEEQKDDILLRAQEVFPAADAGLWRTIRGRIRHDRCEAALLAYYGSLRKEGLQRAAAAL